MEYLSLGKIIGTHGLDGKVKVFSSTFFSKDRYKKGNELFLISPDDSDVLKVTVKSFSQSKGIDLVSFNEINNPEDAIKYKGYFIKIDKETASKPKDSYFFSDLELCEVFDTKGNKLGKVKKVEEFPAQITLRVARDNNKDFFVPFIKEFIVEVNIENKLIIINVIEGML